VIKKNSPFTEKLDLKKKHGVHLPNYSEDEGSLEL
jgi:hypothetical protein